MFASAPSEDASTTAVLPVSPSSRAIAGRKRRSAVDGGAGRERRSASTPASSKRVRIPVARAQVEHAGRRRDPVIDEPLAGPAEHDQLLESDEAPRAREQRRVVLGEPAQLRDRQHRMHRRAGRLVERERGSVAAPLVGDRVRAAVHPGDHARERLAVVVDAQHAVHRARESDRGHLAAAHAHVGEHAREHAHRRAVDDVRVLLDEVGLRRLEPVELRTARDLAPGRRDREHLDRRRAEIDPDDDGRVAWHRAAVTSARRFRDRFDRARAPTRTTTMPTSSTTAAAMNAFANELVPATM